MLNLSQIKRQRMFEFLNKIREEHSDDASLIAINEIETELTDKKYGLVWEEHEERVDIEMLTKIPVFSESVDREILSDENLQYNFLLEGDNLHSLKLLMKTHKGKIDLIYIDPPYNTGNKDFMYDDNYINEDDGFKHSKWLSFMDERLKLARDLLTDEGAVFIQISDIELAQLKLLCDNVFGEGNFLNIINVNMKNIAGASGGGEDKRFKKNCEYILIYAKNYAALPIFNSAYVYTELSELIKTYIEEGVSWKYTSVLIYEGDKEYVGSTVDGNGNDIKIYTRRNPIIKSIKQVAKDNGITEQEAYKIYGTKIFQTTNAQSSIRTRVMNYRSEQCIKEDLLSVEYIPRTGRNRGKVYEQFYKGDKCRLFVWLRDTSEEIDGVLYKKDLQGTYWDYTGYMKNLTKEGNIGFNNGKKPVELLKRIISLYPAKDITVLDFFAGSGTTGHAVISQNAEDGGKRNFILCTNNEEGICETITYKRLSNVIFGYTSVTGKVFKPNPANLKYYKTSFIDKHSEDLDYSVNDELLNHIVEMVQLEYAVSLDGLNYILLMSDDAADAFITDVDKLEKCKGLYLSSTVLLTSEQIRTLADSGVSVYTIPDYYFESELLEVGER